MQVSSLKILDNEVDCGNNHILEMQNHKEECSKHGM